MSNGKNQAPVKVFLELGKKRVFASAAEWPGWCRAGKTEELALQALAACGPRYAAVPRRAGVQFPEAEIAFKVIERLPGSATTEFGAPGVVARGDAAPMAAGDAAGLADLLGAAWEIFDLVVAAAPEGLRKGPRGGGRDRTAIVRHVVGAETAYASKIGLKEREPDPGDIDARVAMRARMLEVVRQAAGAPPPEGKQWPVRYFARRTAWHALDHAWEIEDRS